MLAAIRQRWTKREVQRQVRSGAVLFSLRVLALNLP